MARARVAPSSRSRQPRWRQVLWWPRTCPSVPRTRITDSVPTVQVTASPVRVSWAEVAAKSQPPWKTASSSRANRFGSWYARWGSDQPGRQSAGASSGTIVGGAVMVPPAGSDVVGRDEGRVGERGPVKAEPGDVFAGGAGECEVGEDPADQAGELEGVARADEDLDARVGGQRAEHEVLVGRDRVQAGLGVELRTQEPRQMIGQKRALALDPDRVRLEPALRGGHLVAAGVLAELGGHLAVHREAIEVVPPVPHEDREAGGAELGEVGGGVVGHLFLGDHIRQTAGPGRQDLVGPPVSGGDDPADEVGLLVGDHLDPGGGGAQRQDRLVRVDLCAAGPSEGHVNGVRLARVDEPRGLLIDGLLVAVKPELGPAGDQGVPVQQLELDPVVAERRDVAGDVARPGVEAGAGPYLFDHQAPRADDEWDPGLRLDLAPGVVCRRRQAGVRLLVLGQPDDAGVVLRGAVAVEQVELLQAQYGGA